VSLTTRPKFVLEIVEGPQAGQRLPVTGLTVALGGPPDPQAPKPEKSVKWFDQEIQFGDYGVPCQCLCLKWKELENAFELSRAGRGRPLCHGGTSSRPAWNGAPSCRPVLPA